MVDILGDGGSQLLSIRITRTSTSLPSDLLLSIHKTFLDPGTVFLVGANGIGVQQLCESGFDLLVHVTELVRVLVVYFASGVAVSRCWVNWDWIC